MNIAMFTNTYLPHVGGVARSVEAFATAFRAAGHRVMVVAPTFEGQPETEVDVIRVPAIQNFNGSDFSVRLPVPSGLLAPLDDFKPDIIHSHHPFLLGDTALRVAAQFQVPIVFTHHTMYEQYTHYVPGDSRALQQFAIQLVTGYCNLCSLVLAPSESIRSLLVRRGVQTEIEVVPTGVDVELFSAGSVSQRAKAKRTALGIPTDAYVVGHLGRLAPEKNLPFLADSVSAFLKRRPDSYFLLVGSGPSLDPVRQKFRRSRLQQRLITPGSQSGDDLVDCYHAMDLFAFASESETQGMVLTEAMAAGLPVVALDAPGAREVVRDRKNGVLVYRKDSRLFARELAWVAELGQERREFLSSTARETALELSIERCAELALSAYEAARSRPYRTVDSEHSSWSVAVRQLETEWELFSNVTDAFSITLERWLWILVRPLQGVRKTIRAVRKVINRAELTVRMLKLPRKGGGHSPRGLILVQIDGLSRSVFEHALERRKLPFLRWLNQRHEYSIHTFYSGVPSSTPAVQAELLYGQRTAVPAFGYRDRATSTAVRMFEPECAANVEARLRTQGSGLLAGGSSYSIIYQGGAESPHFCPSAFSLDSFDWRRTLKMANPLAILGLVLFNLWSLIRCLTLVAVELLIAIWDLVRGAYPFSEFFYELKFIPSRIFIGIGLRELVVIGAKTDIACGSPIIYLNLLGYDEQAHRRGPGSGFALWSLKGIDDAIKRLYWASRYGSARQYDLWIFSDHGQEASQKYTERCGVELRNAVRKVISDVKAGSPGEAVPATRLRGKELRAARRTERVAENRALWFRSKPKSSDAEELTTEESEEAFQLMALGPVAHLYLLDEQLVNSASKREIATQLVRNARVPVTFCCDDSGTVFGYTIDGEFQLPESIEQLVGLDHPFLNELRQDIPALIKHVDAGEVVLAGWRAGHEAWSFAFENGAHGGFGPNETGGFVLTPPHAPIIESLIGPENSSPTTNPAANDGPGSGAAVSAYLRPLGLRDSVQRFVKLHKGHRRRASEVPPHTDRDVVRVMSYNVHSCRGLDGTVSPARIADVLRQYEPDIIAVQELDVRHKRSDQLDQPAQIAEALQYYFHFHPVMELDGTWYGNALFSRFPIEVINASILPTARSTKRSEPRGVLWARIKTNGISIDVFTSHLGLRSSEQEKQVSALLGPDWLGNPNCGRHVVFAGDLNLTPSSGRYRKFSERLNDTHQCAMVRGALKGRTWSARLPVRRIDYVFASDAFEVCYTTVPRTTATRVASDHLPVLADVRPKIDSKSDETSGNSN